MGNQGKRRNQEMQERLYEYSVEDYLDDWWDEAE